MVGPWSLNLVVVADKASHLGLAICFRQKMVEQKSWATISQSIKALLRWKFRVLDLFHDPGVLPVSLAHLVARTGCDRVKMD